MLRSSLNARVIPGLDAARAVAVTLVILFHFSLLPSSAGELGVMLFFVLSGFLITGILLREYATTGKISLREFYRRRAFRIFPTFYVCWCLELLLVRYHGVAVRWWEPWATFFLHDGLRSGDRRTGDDSVFAHRVVVGHRREVLSSLASGSFLAAPFRQKTMACGGGLYRRYLDIPGRPSRRSWCPLRSYLQRLRHPNRRTDGRISSGYSFGRCSRGQADGPVRDILHSVSVAGTRAAAVVTCSCRFRFTNQSTPLVVNDGFLGTARSYRGAADSNCLLRPPVLAVSGPSGAAFRRQDFLCSLSLPCSRSDGSPQNHPLRIQWTPVRSALPHSR